MNNKTRGMTMKEYESEIRRRLWSGRVRRIMAYVDGHAWAAWVVGALMTAAFLGAAEVGYAAAHGGADVWDAALDWAGVAEED